jgi:predicted hydrolase (HD superfamily)
VLREAALAKLNEWVKSNNLRRHCQAVEKVMHAAARKYGGANADANQWALAGLLHDADYEIAPSEHPQVVVDWLRAEGEDDVAHAISAHGINWGVPYLTPMDRALVACDEITGFISACAHLRPDGVLSLEAPSVLKKLKNPKFAAGVDRAEVSGGAAILGVDLAEHITFIISVLREHAVHLCLTGGETPNNQPSAAENNPLPSAA